MKINQNNFRIEYPNYKDDAVVIWSDGNRICFKLNDRLKIKTIDIDENEIDKNDIDYSYYNQTIDAVYKWINSDDICVEEYNTEMRSIIGFRCIESIEVL